MYPSSASQMAKNLFSKLDTKNQGYIEKTDLQTSLSQVASDSSAATVSADDIFNRFDNDSDGKITKDEMTSGFEKLAAELDIQFNQSRVAGGMQGGPQGAGGMPPPPPPSGNDTDTGFTKDELSAQLEETGGTDSSRSSLISNIVENFDKADTDGDGKVSLQESIAYEQSTTTASSSASSSGSSPASSSADSGNVMRTIMQLMQSYGMQAQSESQTSLFSALA